MKIHENLTDDLSVSVSEEFDGRAVVTDDLTGEVGLVVAQTADNRLIVQWRNAENSESHEEFELILPDALNVTIDIQDEENEVETVGNPFGFFAKKKKFFVDFNADGEFHQTVITARNKDAAVKIAKRGFKNFKLSDIEETN